jgi:hypothetical protein
MGKHSGSGTSENRSHEGKHRASEKDLNADTVPVRVDTDRGRVTGWSVGREVGPDNYDR